MFRVVFFLLPLIVVLIVGPIWLAAKRRGGSTWFPAQILTLLGFLGGLAALHQKAFGDVVGPTNVMIVTAATAIGWLVAWIVLPRAPK